MEFVKYVNKFYNFSIYIEIMKSKELKNIECRRCKNAGRVADHIVKHGTYATVKFGKRINVMCRTCGHTFNIEGESNE